MSQQVRYFTAGYALWINSDVLLAYRQILNHGMKHQGHKREWDAVVDWLKGNPTEEGVTANRNAGFASKQIGRSRFAIAIPESEDHKKGIGAIRSYQSRTAGPRSTFSANEVFRQFALKRVGR